MKRNSTQLIVKIMVLALVASAPLESAQANAFSAVWKAVKTMFKSGDEAAEVAARAASPENAIRTERALNEVMQNYPPLLRSTKEGGQPLIDLTTRAYRGELVAGAARSLELRDLQEALMRRSGGHAVVVGEPGVGKSQLIADLTQEITKINSTVPEQLRNTRVVQLDRSVITSGSSVQGTLDATLYDLKEMIRGLRPDQQEKIILVIEDIGEWHTLLQSAPGGTNLLLSRIAEVMEGTQVKIVFTATDADMTKVISQHSISRSLTRVHITPPNPDQAYEMVKAHLPELESLYGVNFPVETVSSAIRLAERFVADVKLPGSAISLLERAAVHTRVNTATRPRILLDIENQIGILNRKLADNQLRQGPKYDLNSVVFQRQLDSLQRNKEFYETLHSQIQVFSREIDANTVELNRLQNTLSQTARDADKIPIQQQIEALTDEINDYRRSLRERTDNVALGNEVNEYALAEIIARDRRSTVEKVLEEIGRDANFLNRVTEEMHSRIVGQRHVVETVLRTLGVNKDRAGKGVRGAFLGVGASRTGKSEFGRALGDIYGQGKVLKLDSANYTTETAVNRLIGADPGYLGYDSGGLLTNFIKANPDGVIWIDEVEKGGKEFFNLLLSALDETNPSIMPKLGETAVSTRENIFWMTGNLLGPHDPFAQAAVQARKMSASDFADETLKQITDPVELTETLQRSLRHLTRADGTTKVLSDELLNRLNGIFKFYEFTPAEMIELVEAMIRDFVKSLDTQAIGMALDREVLEAISLRAGRETRNSARVRTNINQFIGARVNTLTTTPLRDFAGAGQDAAGMALKEGDIVHVTLKPGVTLEGVEHMDVPQFQQLLDFHVISYEETNRTLATVIRTYSFDGGNALKRTITSQAHPEEADGLLRNALAHMLREGRLSDPHLPNEVDELMDILNWSSGR